MLARYIMKSHQYPVGAPEWVYDIYDDEFNHLVSVKMTPDNAEELKLTSLSPVEVHFACLARNKLG